MKTLTKAVTNFNYKHKLKRVITTSLYRNALYLMLNTAVTSLFGFFFWIAVARLYSVVDVGFSTAAISAINLLTLFSEIGLSFCIIRFLPQAEEPRKLINTFLTLTGLACLAAAGIFIAGLDTWSPGLGFIRQNPIFIVVFCGTVILVGLSKLLDSVFVAKRRAGFVLSNNSMISFFKLVLVMVFALFLHSFGVVASWGIAYGIIITLVLFIFLPRIESSYRPALTLDIGQIRGIKQYSGFSYIDSLLAGATAMIIPLIVLNRVGTIQNAFYYTAWMIANLLFAIPSSVAQSLFAEGSNSEASFKENIIRSVKFTFLLLLPGAILLFIASKWMLLAFGPEYAANGLTLLWVLILTSLPRGITYIYTSLLRVQGRLLELIIIRVFITVAVLVFCYLTLPVYGIISVGYVWLAVQVVVAIFVIIRLFSWSSRTADTGRMTY
jgi:O-antigen/teichoic acid export membrane protein